MAAQRLLEGDSEFFFWLLTPGFSKSPRETASDSTNLAARREFKGHCERRFQKVDA